MRCHTPGFGLRIGQQRISVCFVCNNAYVDNELMSLDASSAAARELLAFLEGVKPLD